MTVVLDVFDNEYTNYGVARSISRNSSMLERGWCRNGIQIYRSRPCPALRIVLMVINVLVEEGNGRCDP